MCWLVMQEVNELRIGVGGGGYWEVVRIKMYLHIVATYLIHRVGVGSKDPVYEASDVIVGSLLP